MVPNAAAQAAQSCIVNDPNDWMAEGAGGGPTASAQPRYLLDLIARITTVSIQTQEIVNSLPSLKVNTDA